MLCCHGTRRYSALLPWFQEVQCSVAMVPGGTVLCCHGTVLCCHGTRRYSALLPWYHEEQCSVATVAGGTVLCCHGTRRYSALLPRYQEVRCSVAMVPGGTVLCYHGTRRYSRTASAALLPWYQEVQSDSDSSSVTVTPPLSPQTRPPITTTTAVLPTVVAPISASRTQSPVINPAVTQAADMVHGYVPLDGRLPAGPWFSILPSTKRSGRGRREIQYE